MGKLKAAGVVFVVLLVILIAKGQTTTAANIVSGIFDAIISFFGNLGEFIGKVVS